MKKTSLRQFKDKSLQFGTMALLPNHSLPGVDSVHCGGFSSRIIFDVQRRPPHSFLHATLMQVS
jgi:hypothetical protein